MLSAAAILGVVVEAVEADDATEMVIVPAGEFWMGADDRDDDEKPRRRVYLDRYAIDRYEVTNAQYRRFVDATGHATPRFSAPVDPGTLTGPAQPVVGVTWHDAEAYCRWAGKRLPTEAEWEKAARGVDGRTYPWGDRWDPSRANSKESGLGGTAPVGSYPRGASPYGVHDMAGNVWEWVADWYAADYYRRSMPRNPMGPDAGTWKVLRGGAWGYLPSLLRTTARLSTTPDLHNTVVGFRCATSIP
jgi:formylglycine-generating enzyme required for sulfatase activity